MLRRGLPTAAALALLALAPSARAADIAVSPPPANCSGSACTPITNAIAAASAGDRLVLAAGIYTEQVNVNKSVDLFSSAGAGLVFTGSGAVVNVTDAASNIDGLAIVNQGSGPALAATVSPLVGTATTVNVSRTILLAGPGASAAVTATGSVQAASITASFVTVDRATSGLTAGMNATVTAANSIVPAPPATGNNIAPDPALFVDAAGGNYHLRRSAAAAIDKGPAAVANQTDIDGQARTGPTDLGADEAVPLAPSAPSIAANPSTTTVNQPVSFTASGASDPDPFASRGIAAYRWNFGDGATAETAGPSVSHTYAGPATFVARANAVDFDGNVSPDSQPIAVTVNAAGSGGGGGTPGGGTPGGDPTTTGPPLAKISSPRSGATLTRTRVVTKVKRIKRRGKIVKRKVKVRTTRDVFIRGTALDANGVRSVRVAVVRGSATGQRCQFFDSRSFSRRLCAVPFYLFARISDTRWSLKISKKAKLPAGRYTVFVSAIDFKSNPSVPSPAAGSSRVFRVK